LSPLSFFQINAEQTEKLYNTALKFANLSGDETVADLYCGAGTISMLLARHARFVTGIEIVPDAVRDAKENAVRNGVSNVRFYCGEAEKQLPLLAEQGLKADVVVLDPPRKGAEEAVLRTVAAIAPKRVVYVSCNPATQARDAKLLTSLGYQITDCQSVDMFCQTAGIENVLGFARISE
ncbi:MAG: 23S rRNA (uracil(1939)-C(5))-methyltransferase RlmD, partial [Clostridia bacterium]|nr:23S rRNA (uracil(1939)-C(5))-methyltransferase RlmD [Clostridia bacterium]